MSTTALYERLRTAGAAAREVLIRAAAQTWSIDVAECRTENGFVINARGEKLSYGSLPPAAAKLPLSAAPPLKDSSRFRLIGKPVARLDTPAKCNGSAIYGIDVSRSRHAQRRHQDGAVLHRPGDRDQEREPNPQNARRARRGEDPALRSPTRTRDAQHPHVSRSPRYNAVCVVADHFWQAKRAIDSLDVVFDRGARRRSLDRQDRRRAGRRVECRAWRHRARAGPAAEKSCKSARRRSSSDASCCRTSPMPRTSRVNATASYKDGAVEVWGPIQSVTACQEAVAQAVGCAADNVTVNVTFLGGSFGRKIVPDFVVQAVHASKAVGRPVKLIRSREEDTQHDVYRPNAGGRLRAVVDDAGYPLAVHARVAGQSLFGATRKSWLDQTPEGAWDESMVDGIYNQGYRLPHFLVETVDTPLPVPVYFMRSVGSTAAVFFWESMISELAHRAKIDQYAYRRNLLSDDPLALRVLDAAAQASDWGTRAARYVPRHRLQLLHRPRRPLQNLRRAGRGAAARRRHGLRSSASSARSIPASRSIRTRSRRRSRAASASR